MFEYRINLYLFNIWGKKKICKYRKFIKCKENIMVNDLD